MGKVRMEDEDPAIQSACSLYIYQGAKEILEMKNKEARRAALNKIPALIRPHVEKEVWRIFERNR